MNKFSKILETFKIILGVIVVVAAVIAIYFAAVILSVIAVLVVVFFLIKDYFEYKRELKEWDENNLKSDPEK